jgi:sarcosine oxidase subunit delta
MLLIPCPWCGERDEVEFRYGGEAHISRADPARADDAAWADYLYMRNNSKGAFAERWFNLLRDTASHRIIAVYRIGERPPAGTPPAGSHGGDP